MLYADSNYKSVPELLAAYAPEYKKQHFHVHGGWHHNSAEDTLLSVFKDDGNQLHQGARQVLKGGLIGLISGAFYVAKFGNQPTDFVHTRSVLGKLIPAFGVIGALAGLSWWFIHDLTLCPHGRDASMQRQILATSIQGGLLIGGLYHPAAFGYGMLAGAAWGLLADQLETRKLPKNFQLWFKNFDMEKRRNLLRDDEEYEMSLRSVVNSTSRVFHPI